MASDLRDTASKQGLPAALIFDRMVGPPAGFAKDYFVV